MSDECKSENNRAIVAFALRELVDKNLVTALEVQHSEFHGVIWAGNIADASILSACEGALHILHQAYETTSLPSVRMSEVGPEDAFVVPGQAHLVGKKSNSRRHSPKHPDLRLPAKKIIKTMQQDLESALDNIHSALMLIRSLVHVTAFLHWLEDMQSCRQEQRSRQQLSHSSSELHQESHASSMISKRSLILGEESTTYACFAPIIELGGIHSCSTDEVHRNDVNGQDVQVVSEEVFEEVSSLPQARVLTNASSGMQPAPAAESRYVTYGPRMEMAGAAPVWKMWDLGALSRRSTARRR